MSDDQPKNSNPFFEFHHENNHHHTISSQGFAFPIVSSFNPFMYNHPQPPLQNPNEFDFLQGAVDQYNTLSSAPNGVEASGGGHGGGGGDSIPMTPNSSASISSQEAAGGEEDSSKSKKDVQTIEEGDGKSKNVKAKEKELGKKPKEARFAFMTKSEVDNLEDGYRWRKYGQKAVKNSPFPRSYYRCTSQKCGVKKRIERSYQDPTVVITTYEGHHNHHCPSTMRSMLAPPLPPPFSQDVFFAHRNNNPTAAFYTPLADTGHGRPQYQQRRQQPQVPDQYGFLMPGAGSSVLHEPEP